MVGSNVSHIGKGRARSSTAAGVSEGGCEGELYWLSGHRTLRLPACGAKVTAAMTSACVVSFLKQPQMGCILFLLFTGASSPN